MKKKHLGYLAGALMLLLLLRLVMDRGPGTASSLEDAGFRLVLEQGLEPESIRWIRVGGPGGSGALVAQDDGAGWTVTSAFAAPADREAIDTFLSVLAGLRGEVRGQGESLFAEFGVDEGSAARIEVGSGPGEVLATLWVGGAGDGPGAHFVRSEGSDSILHVVDGVADDLGLMGEDRDPPSSHWLRLELFDVATDAVDYISAERPDLRWRLEKTSPAGAEEGAPPDWRVIEPPTGLTVDGGGVDGFVSRIARIRAASVLDPASEACSDDALDSRLGLRAGDATQGLRFGTRLLDDDIVAAMLDGDATCWGLKRWTAESLMPRASQLLELGRPFGDPAPEASEFTRIDLVTGDSLLRLERDGDDEPWRLSPPERAPADGPRVDRLLSALRFLQWDDLAVATAVNEPDRAVHATITAHAGKRSWTLRLLGERPGGPDGARYAEFDGGPAAPSGYLAVVTGSVVESLVASLDELRADAPEDE